MRPNSIVRLQSIYDPFSAAVVPLLDGLARRRLLHRGAQQREARVQGMCINYYQRLRWGRPRDCSQPSGRNLPIVLLHGIGDSGLTWALLMRRLARNHDVYAPDLAGHGLSGLPAGHQFATVDEHLAVLVAFMREVIGRPALVVGNSLGGLLAVRLAWAAPEWVRGVVLLNPGGAPLHGRTSYDPFFAKLSAKELTTTYQITGELIGTVPRLLLLPALRSIQHVFQRPVILDAYAASDDDVYLTAASLQQLVLPAALIWGMADHFLPEGSFEFFDQNLASAPRLLLRHCGHLPQRERPLSVARFVAQFAEGLVANTVAARDQGSGIRT